MPTKPRTPDDRNFIPFNQDVASMIRKEALVGLQQSHDEEARRLLIQVARQPGPLTTADFGDRQQTQDEKTVAIRALGNYKHPDCVETLKHILRTEKEIGLRRRAKESLDESTGRRWPLELEAWQRPEVEPLPNSDGIIQNVGAWFTK
jgi:HEAT repeat protein